MTTNEISKEQFNTLVEQTIQDENLSAEKNPHFFQDNKAVVKKKI